MLDSNVIFTTHYKVYQNAEDGMEPTCQQSGKIWLINIDNVLFSNETWCPGRPLKRWLENCGTTSMNYYNYPNNSKEK